MIERELFAIWWMALLAALCLLFSPASYAQGVSLLPPSSIAGPYSPYFPAGQTGFAVNSVTTSASGAAGATARVAGTAVASRAGAAVAVPVAFDTAIAGAGIADAAAAAYVVAKRFAGPVGVAVTAWEIYDAYKKSGVTTCPPPDFFCKPGPVNQPQPPDSYYLINGTGTSGVQYPTALAAAQARVAAIYKENVCLPSYGKANCPTAVTGPCTYSANFLNFYCPIDASNYGQVMGNLQPKAVPCSPPLSPNGAGGCIDNTPVPPLPMTDAEFAQKTHDVIAADASGATAKAFLDAVIASNARAASNNVAGVPSVAVFPPTGSPSTLASQPVTLPQTVTSQVTFKDSAGVDQVSTQKNTATITPTISGAGIQTGVSYSISNVTTTTTTQNQPNGQPPLPDQSSTETKTTSVAASAPAPQNLPTDYNREATQLKIEQDLNSDGAPPMADQTANIATAAAKSNTDIKALQDQAVANKTTDQAMWWTWIWQPPAGVCTPFSATVHGYAVAWDLCPTFDMFRDVMGWILALLAALEIYNTGFKVEGGEA